MSDFNSPAPSSAPQRTSGLAIASLVCSLCSFLCLPFGFIPGIICGHLASGRIRSTPGLGGRGLATAGLVLGYIGLSLYLVVFAVLAALFLFAGRELVTEVKRQIEQQERAAAHQPFPLPNPAEPEAPLDTTPDLAGWNLDLDAMEIPDEPVSGRVHGEPFKMDRLAYQGGFLKFRQGEDFFADLEMNVVVFVDLSELPEKKFKFDAEGNLGDRGPRPHIYMHWKGSGDEPKQQVWTENYALRLEFGRVTDGKIPGRIYLCVPDPDKSFIRGTFELPMSR